ncbi:coiled-coil domain-containing protein, partial [Clarias magur]
MAESRDTVLEQVEELRRSNAAIQTENEVFEIFLSQLESLSLATTDAQMEKEAGPPNLLTLEQKYHVAVCVLEETRKELKQLSLSLARNTEKYKASIEDADMRLAEIKRERHDFEQFIAKTHQVQALALRAQKAIGYMERKIKAKKALTERKRRRNTFLRTQTCKQQRIVNQKEQMQEKLRSIDLEHLKHKNIQYRELFQKYQELLRSHRVLVRKSQHGLNVCKERLKREMDESELLSRKIASHEEKLVKIGEQQQKVETERAQAEALNRKLKSQLENFRVPDVMTYVKSKVKTERLRKTVKALERKARIAE